MIQRPIPPHFTVQQRSFLTQATQTREHLYLRATAGSGKTTTLVEAAWHLMTPAMLFAYNKSAVTDLQVRLPPRCQARTLHSHGRTVLRAVNPGIRLDAGKAGHMAAELCPRNRGQQHALARAWSGARERWLTALDGPQLDALAAQAQWEQNPAALRELLEHMNIRGEQLWADEGVADFTDLLWLPLRLGLAGESLGLGLLDESQDLTPLRQEFVLHLLGLRDGPTATAGRLIFVGDPEQLLYGWDNAVPDGLTQLQQRVGAVECPLSVSWRCPAEVVRYAQAYSSFIQPAPGAAAGRVEHVAARAAGYARGDVVLCRTNAPLLELGLELMARGLSIHLSGVDLLQRLGAALERTLPAQGSFANDGVAALVQQAFLTETATLTALAAGGDRGARRKLGELADLKRCVRYLAWSVSRPCGKGTLDLTRQLLREVCAERAEADVLLSSVHRAKGREWPRVTVLYPELMPAPYGDPTEEQAVQFVAGTRAQEVLRFAYGEQAWAAGQLVQPGWGPGPERTAAPEQIQGRVRPVPTAVQSEIEVPSRVKAPGVGGLAPVSSTLHSTLQAQIRHQARVQSRRAGPSPEQSAATRLRTLLDSPRGLIRDWAETQLASLRASGGAYLPDAGELELYERSWRLARQALAALPAPGVPVCVFERPVARMRYATLVRAGKKIIRLRVGGEELRFNASSGELISGSGPLSTFILPAALSALNATADQTAKSGARPRGLHATHGAP